MTPLIITPVPRLDEDIYEYTLNILFYSALIHKAEEGGFWITFPDFPECMTQGEDIQAAYTMAYAVSYTHLDVYKRQVLGRRRSRVRIPPLRFIVKSLIFKDFFVLHFMLYHGTFLISSMFPFVVSL